MVMKDMVVVMLVIILLPFRVFYAALVVLLLLSKVPDHPHHAHCQDCAMLGLRSRCHVKNWLLPAQLHACGLSGYQVISASGK